MLGNSIALVVLCALVILFAWLTRRAWKSKHTILRWLGVVSGGLLTLLFAGVTAFALLSLYKLYTPHNNPVASIQVARTPQQIARGEKLAYICASCHTPGNQLPLSGADFVAKFGLPPIGTFYAPNLTPAGNINTWSDGEVIRAIREGVRNDGRSLLIMPSYAFRNMSDADVQAVVAYLRSQAGAGQPTPANDLNIFGALFASLADWQTAQAPVAHVAMPEAGTKEYGKYMIDVIGCQSCHGEQLQGKPDTGQPGPPPGPNLTLIVPQWSEEQFMTFFNTGTMPGGGVVPLVALPGGLTQPRMPWTEVRAVASDAELKAIYAYLHSLPPAHDPVK